MSWSKHHSRGKRGYHHGNLREALVQAALSLIGERGSEGVTLAEAARMAGVSAAAPYRHFKDREALMAAVAAEGYAKFADALETAWGDGGPDCFKGLERIGRAYLAFAREEPALYAAMFESSVAVASDSALLIQADRAFDVLQRACDLVHETLPADRRAPARMIALHVWALAHGIASLFARGDAGRRPIPVPPEDLLEAGVLIYLSGLGHEA
ncbi:MAG: TetR/AcrR family transcriptional regulator [Rhodobiaceae bacterium]|nr:TetR/AcrR family transcriptional regulator [Rhodobiaceae bacterium]MCC0015325.1 TetR/AcrR family transcriptional regulator [Rhodobiaceae bacterium]MCC0053436.1 TetR/AcrR family transcriptional regulator [Rhodobiaceae bacterium]